MARFSFPASRLWNRARPIRLRQRLKKPTSVVAATVIIIVVAEEETETTVHEVEDLVATEVPVDRIFP